MDLRVREPIIAESLKIIAAVLFCCFPLALIGLMLWPKAEEQGTTAQLNQLLICEITAGEGSLLLDGPSLPLLEKSGQATPEISRQQPKAHHVPYRQNPNPSP